MLGVLREIGARLLRGGGLDDVELSLKRSNPLLASANAALHERAIELLTRS
jgi:hypothetical protein